METKYRSIAEAVLILGIIIVGGIAVGNLGPEAKRCVSRNLIMPSCDSIKSWGDGEKCINEELGNKICPEPWEDLSNIIEDSPQSTETFKVAANGGIFSCEIDNGYVGSYSHCIKQDGKEGYLAELIVSAIK